MRRYFSVVALFLFVGCLGPAGTEKDLENYQPEALSEEAKEELAENQVTILTTMGAITVELNPEKAPITTANFLRYIDAGFYDGDDDLGVTTFHRVIEDFMIQGGGYNLEGTQKTTYGPITSEASNGLSNLRGTVAMARTTEPNSATSQFFINHIDNTFLDYTEDNAGYTVFGEVIAGMDVVDAIATVATDENDVPVEPVIMDDVVRWED